MMRFLRVVFGSAEKAIRRADRGLAYAVRVYGVQGIGGRDARCRAVFKRFRERAVFEISGNEKGGVRAPPFRKFRGMNYAALSCAFALRQIILSKTEKDKPKISETIVDRAMP